MLPLIVTQSESTEQAGVPEHDYTMEVDLAVIKSLGINLYSNAAAVLSELVANAYDADASHVNIAWLDNGKKIVVADDGCGMTKKQINKRFLTVGYEKRTEEGSKSKKWKRPFMGRKGIGKLSVFSIAKSVTVYSTVGNNANGLILEVDALEAAIRSGQPYHPDSVAVPTEHARQGTVLVLQDLIRGRTGVTATALRKRLARRFATLGSQPAKQGGFSIKIDNKAVTYKDRDDLKKLEFIWEFGSKSLPTSAVPKATKRLILKDTHIPGHPNWKVRGWIGTVRKPADLAGNDDSGPLGNVIVLARKRPIQEGIVEKLNFNRIFTSYVTGQIEADFLDLDDGFEDIATSDRQRLIEDDDRVIGLQAFLRTAFKKASDEWSLLRPKAEAKDYLKNFPELRKWVDTRENWQRSAAEKMIGTIAALPLDDDDPARAQRADLMRSGVLAFERMALKSTAEQLEAATSLSAADILPLLNQQDLYETALWGDILSSRVEAIRKLRALTQGAELERVIQEHLFQNLWLLDPAWERATESIEMEKHVRQFHPDVIPIYADGDPIDGRVDIRYSTLSGRHVIVELKRYDRKVALSELKEQGEKYYAAVEDVLARTGRGGQDIEVIFVLGSAPTVKVPGKGSKEDAIRQALENINGSYKLYDELIVSAENQYAEYLAASDIAGSLNALLAALGPEESSDNI